MDIEKISDEEKQIVSVLKNIDLNGTDSMVLLYILKNNGCIAREIERTIDLRQPEVSLSTNVLRRIGWIKIKKVKKTGKGRPILEYYLAVTRDDIINDVERSVKKKIEQMQNGIKQLQQQLLKEQ